MAGKAACTGCQAALQDMASVLIWLSGAAGRAGGCSAGRQVPLGVAAREVACHRYAGAEHLQALLSCTPQQRPAVLHVLPNIQCCQLAAGNGACICIAARQLPGEVVPVGACLHVHSVQLSLPTPASV